ncbi:hypothetical protein [Streptomyces sp. NBRC 109706]|uniref:hypothetical protein n=1 Tax=Streptomyces sp. NBRC 109706 TaxID=1550035 RepID=UPI000AEA3742|nr:hypothetical protein [Streptomyces sp. NBRC 109706]
MSRSDVFAITLDPGQLSPDAIGQVEALGVIRIGAFQEEFHASLSFWSADDYRRSWRAGFAVLADDPAATSCLVTSISDPATSNFVFCWPLYRSGETVYVQNSLIFLEELTSPFDPAAPWHSVLPRETVGEEDQPISEWTTNMTALSEFFSG